MSLWYKMFQPIIAQPLRTSTNESCPACSYLIVESHGDPGDEDGAVLGPGVHPHVHGGVGEPLLQGPELGVGGELLQQPDEALLVHIGGGLDVLGSDGDPVGGVGSEA